MCQNNSRLSIAILQTVNKEHVNEIARLHARLAGVSREITQCESLVECLVEDPDFRVMPGEKTVTASAIRVISELRSELAECDRLADQMLELLPDEHAKDCAARGLSIGESVIEYIWKLQEEKRMLMQASKPGPAAINSECEQCDDPNCRGGFVGRAKDGKISPDRWWVS